MGYRIDLSQLQFNFWKSLNALHYRSNIIQTVVVEVTDFDIENARSKSNPGDATSDKGSAEPASSNLNTEPPEDFSETFIAEVPFRQ